MPALICGSLAFDTIATFPGRFAQQILPEQLHILNVSFLVPTLRREFGGCAGNIAYTLKALGGEPRVMAALGADGAEYLARMQTLGLDTRHVLTVSDAQLIRTMRFFAERMKQVVEPTGCLGAAAVLEGAAGAPEWRGRRIGVVLSGGNVDLARYGAWLSGG